MNIEVTALYKSGFTFQPVQSQFVSFRRQVPQRYFVRVPWHSTFLATEVQSLEVMFLNIGDGRGVDLLNRFVY